LRTRPGNRIPVGEQDHPVVHRKRQVAIEDQLARCRRGEPQKTAGDLAEQRHRGQDATRLREFFLAFLRTASQATRPRHDPREMVTLMSGDVDPREDSDR
jgi:hypothetical protein